MLRTRSLNANSSKLSLSDFQDAPQLKAIALYGILIIAKGRVEPLNDLRPRSVAQLIDHAIKLYRLGFGHYLGVVAITQLPLGLLNILFSALVLQGFSSGLLNLVFKENLSGSRAILPVLAYSFASTTLWFVVGSFTSAALVYSLRSHLDGHTLTAWRAYTASFRQAILVLMTNIAKVIAIGLVLAAPIITGVLAALSNTRSGDTSSLTGVILWSLLTSLLGLLVSPFALFLVVRWQLTDQVCVLERRNPLRSPRRSASLIKQGWWRAAGFDVILYLLILALSYTPSGIAQLVLSLGVTGAGSQLFIVSVITGSLTLVTSVLLWPIGILSKTLYYYDLRVRREGYDLELAIQSYQRAEQLA